MKQVKPTVDEQIAAFMARKEKQFPELSEKQVVKTHDQQRGRLIRNVLSTFRLTNKSMRLA